MFWEALIEHRSKEHQEQHSYCATAVYCAPASSEYWTKACNYCVTASSTSFSRAHTIFAIISVARETTKPSTGGRGSSENYR